MTSMPRAVLAQSTADGGHWLATFALPLKEEVGLGLAVGLTFLGMVLHWQLPRQRMSVEEHMKDGKLTEAQAQRRLRVLSICAPAATISGILLLLSVLAANAA
jgi:hypothetical protein